MPEHTERFFRHGSSKWSWCLNIDTKNQLPKISRNFVNHSARKFNQHRHLFPAFPFFEKRSKNSLNFRVFWGKIISNTWLLVLRKMHVFRRLRICQVGFMSIKGLPFLWRHRQKSRICWLDRRLRWHKVHCKLRWWLVFHRPSSLRLYPWGRVQLHLFDVSRLRCTMVAARWE